MSFFERVYEVVKSIPYGRGFDNGEIAEVLGNKRISRQVGWALHANPNPDLILCYRVVNRFGETSKSFAFGGEDRQ